MTKVSRTTPLTLRRLHAIEGALSHMLAGMEGEGDWPEGITMEDMEGAFDWAFDEIAERRAIVNELHCVDDLPLDGEPVEIIGRLHDQREALRLKVGRLEEALRPFADRCVWNETRDDERVVLSDMVGTLQNSFDLRVSDFRRARQALTPEKGEG